MYLIFYGILEIAIIIPDYSITIVRKYPENWIISITEISIKNHIITVMVKICDSSSDYWNHFKLWKYVI